MKKQLVQVDNLDEFICRVEAKIYIDAGMILTPGAKDELAKRRVTIVHGSCANSSTCGAHGSAAHSGGFGDLCLGGNADFERLLLSVAAMLQKECGITDPATLRAASLQAVQTIKENL